MPAPDTIAAIATAVGAAGVAVVRVSGPDALAVGERLLGRSSSRSRPSPPSRRHRLPHRRLVHATLRDPATGCPLDEGFVCAMHGPRSFTGEDVVELHVHGGVRNVSRVLAAALAGGARLAEPGEFTRRAVRNGRIDLTRAEALRDIIAATSDAALELAHAQRGGAVADAVEALAQDLEAVLVRLEADLDFPDEDETGLDPASMAGPVADLAARTRSLGATWETGRRIRDGYRVVLAGAPNAGKSSLFNALLGADRAIVTTTPGTTRDFLEETVVLGGRAIVLVDTAGLRASADPVEREGVVRAEREIARADLVLALIDGARPLAAPDRDRLAAADPDRTLPVLTKGDLAPATSPADLPAPFGGTPVVSARTGAGLDALRALLRDRAAPATPPDSAGAIVSDRRHRDALDRAGACLERASEALTAALPVELAAADLHAARRALGEIVGAFAPDDLLDRIFATFCIGK